MIRRAGLTLALAALLLCACEKAPPQVTDASASRVVTFAPHLAELMFEIGAGDALVGVSSWSDFPPGVSELPVVGDAFAIDHEQLAMLRPDLLLAWESGMPAHVVDELRHNGFRVETVRTRGLDDVGEALLQLGKLVAREDAARAAANRFASGLSALRNSYSSAEPIRVFYQVSTRPLYTINDEHFLADLVSICGGSNIFADLGNLAPAVADEAVIARDPEVMLAGNKSADEPFSVWERWPDIAANRFGNHFLIDSDTSSRPTSRLLLAAEDICAALDQARRNRASSDTATGPVSRVPPGRTPHARVRAR